MFPITKTNIKSIAIITITVTVTTIKRKSDFRLVIIAAMMITNLDWVLTH